MAKNMYQKRIDEWFEKYGGLTNDVQQKIDKLVEEYDKSYQVSENAKALQFTIGTKFVREFNGKLHSVFVVNDGYEYNGQLYKSLSAIANIITGKHWNGKKFFGVA